MVVRQIRCKDKTAVGKVGWNVEGYERQDMHLNFSLETVEFIER